MSTAANDAVTTNKLLEEILKSRNEVKSTIEESEARLLLKIESASAKIDKLENENRELKERIEQLENDNRKKNVILFGLKRPALEINPDYICEKLTSLLDLELKETDISNIYPIGKTETCPMKIEFSSYFKKLSVFKNCKKLKGSGISIAHDLSVKQRQENQVLRKYLALARLNEKSQNCYIKYNKLHVDGKSYTAEDLERNSTHIEFVSDSATIAHNKQKSVCENKTRQGKGTEQNSIETETSTGRTHIQKTLNKGPSTVHNQKVDRINTRAAASSVANK